MESNKEQRLKQADMGLTEASLREVIARRKWSKLLETFRRTHPNLDQELAKSLTELVQRFPNLLDDMLPDQIQACSTVDRVLAEIMAARNRLQQFSDDS